MEAKEVEGDRGCWVEMERRKFHTFSIFKELLFFVWSCSLSFRSG